MGEIEHINNGKRKTEKKDVSLKAKIHKYNLYTTIKWLF